VVLRSRRFDLFKRLAGKLLIEDESASIFPPAIERLISPTLDVTDLLLDTRGVQENRDLSGTAGTYVPYHTCPVGERWFLIWFVREITAGLTHPEVEIVADNVQFQLVADGTAAQFFSMSIFVLEPGDSVGMISNGNGADTNIFVNLMYRREFTG